MKHSSIIASLIRPWTVALLLATLYIGLVIWRGGGPMGLVLPGTQFTQNNPDGTEGYDGQFVYAIATRPLDPAWAIDVPAYRYQRILLPLLGRIVGIGNPNLILWTLPLINLLALAGATFLVEQVLAAQNMNRWYALVLGLYGGMLLAIRVNLPEPLAIALSLAGLLALQRHRLVAGSLLLGAAILAKETAILFVVGYGLYLLTQRVWRDVFLFGTLSLAPFVIWQVMLWVWFGQPGIGSGGANATPFELIPFAGLWKTSIGGWRTLLLFSLMMIPMAVGPAIWAIGRTGIDIFRRRQAHPWAWVLLINALIIPFIPFSTYREPLAMLRFTIPLVAMVLLYGALRRSKRILFYSSLWLATLIFLIKDPFIL